MKYKYANMTLSKLICDILSENKIENICISPGSRNAPLTKQFLLNNTFNCYSHIDERSCGFFALGMSKASLLPSVIVTTSGTALANLLPSVIESDLSMSPLIIISADRPSHLINTGENQTIKQKNIFRNYTRDNLSIESGDKPIEHYANEINKSILLSMGQYHDKPSGPIHINIAFDEPLIDKAQPIKNSNVNFSNKSKTQSIYKIPQCTRPLIVCGDMKSDKHISNILNLSEKLNAPIFADPLSNIRFNVNHPNILSHYDYYINRLNETPDYIIRFGKKSTTSKKINMLIKNCKNVILLSNNHGYNDDCKIVKPLDFNLIECNKNIDKNWLNTILNLEKNVHATLTKYLNSDSLFEGNVIYSILSLMSNNDNLFIGNSLPIRNLEKFCSHNKKISVYSNRGASGIDGITSAALGMATIKKKNNNVLIVGDISFIHDSNGLLISQRNNINLTIVIINNNGGQIFSTLPYANDDKQFQEYWITPQEIKIKDIASLYNLKYFEIDSIEQLLGEFKSILDFKAPKSNVKLIEIKCDIKQMQLIEEKINSEINKLN